MGNLKVTIEGVKSVPKKPEAGEFFKGVNKPDNIGETGNLKNSPHYGID
jgi:hypothetical protein